MIPHGFRQSMFAWLMLLCSSRAASAGDAIDGYVERQLKDAGIPGLALLAVPVRFHRQDVHGGRGAAPRR